MPHVVFAASALLPIVVLFQILPLPLPIVNPLIVASAVVMRLPEAPERRNHSMLFLLKIRSLLSIVQINCVSGFVHELPDRDHPNDVGDSHTAVPPDIESISPLEPRERPIVLPALESQLLNVRISSLRATTPERVVSEPDTVLRLELVLLRLPERVVRVELVVLKFPERVEMFAVFVAIFPVAVAILVLAVFTRPERVATVAFVVERFPERAERFAVFVAMFPVAVARFEFVLLRFVFVVARDPDTAVISAVLVAILDSVVEILPERVEILAEFVAIFPVAVARFELVVAIDPVIVEIVPLMAFCALVLVK